ncbi:MAG: hypothetical protein JW919_06260 [Candidatus Omnitrophica bacterium]|nr:hypothetical protein [Candidatus Omnitrophota bacterium]
MSLLKYACSAAVIAALFAIPHAASSAQDKEIEQGAEREVREALQSGKDFAREESAEAKTPSSEEYLMKVKEADRAGVIKSEEKDVEEGGRRYHQGYREW